MIEINKDLVSRLIKGQFPQWSDLLIEPVAKDGNDNRTFHLGCDMSVRLPRLGPFLSLPILVPLAKGNPAEGYPWPWSVNRWIQGDTVRQDNISSLNGLAIDLASFLKELHAIDTSYGPPAGAHNFYRGGSLTVYSEETRTALKNLQSSIETSRLHEIWDAALQSPWAEKAVWVHGDIAPGNLLIQDGRLCGVIDFGMLGVGDPACDLTMAWTFFDAESRVVFLTAMECDEGTCNRARGWALWKALITYDWSEKDSTAAADAKRILDIILKEYEQAT